MNVTRLSIRNLTSRPLSTGLSLVLLTLGVGIIGLLAQVNQHVQQQLENNIRGIDMVVGAKGSPLQLILSAVYHIDSPTGNISMQEAQKLKRNRLVEKIIPLSYGDNYSGYRIVGTDHQYPKLYHAELSDGKLWEAPLEVTIGGIVARNTGLQIGDTFVGAHGLAQDGEVHGDHKYQVVGVMDFTNSVMDQLILTATESVWKVHDHEEDHNHASNHEHEPQEDHSHESHDHAHKDHGHALDEEKEITAMLISFRSAMGLIQLPRMINEGTDMQAAVPLFEIERLFGLLGVGLDSLRVIAIVIMIVSGLSIFISLYNALRDREYERALMRTYGSTRWQLVTLVLQEGMILTLGGFILGILCSRVGLWLLSTLMESNYHYTFSGSKWTEEEGWLLVLSLAIGLLASLIPAIRVYRINLSRTLAHA